MDIFKIETTLDEQKPTFEQQQEVGVFKKKTTNKSEALYREIELGGPNVVKRTLPVSYDKKSALQIFDFMFENVQNYNRYLHV